MVLLTITKYEYSMEFWWYKDNKEPVALAQKYPLNFLFIFEGILSTNPKCEQSYKKQSTCSH
jgi:hypothetical protein